MDNDNPCRNEGPGCFTQLIFLVVFLACFWLAGEIIIVIDERLDRLEDAAGIVSPCEDNTANAVSRIDETNDCAEQERNK